MTVTSSQAVSRVHRDTAPREGFEEGRRWRDRAACLSAYPELFFPVGVTGPAVSQTAEAKSVCRTCVVRAQCLSAAIEAGHVDGVWGGLDENERRALERGARPGNRRTDRW